MLLKMGGVETFVSNTGIYRRKVSGVDCCTSDLCIAAANRLLAELEWEKESVDAVIFVTQTPDYILPATAPLIQQRMGLKEECYALDISLGCSGWTYGMSVIAALLQNGSMKRGLLLAGDTILKFCSADDKSTYPLFGDAGTATALEYSEEASPIACCFHTDGAGQEAIIIRDGGYRNMTSAESFKAESYGEGIVRNRLQLELDGMSVFSFGISKAPKSVNTLMEHYGIDKDTVDYFIFHQANLFMNEKIRKKLKLPAEKVPYCMDDFGNTSSASIPLTMVTRMRETLRKEHLKHIACGFGVGLSWGSVYFETSKMACPELIEL